MMMQFTLTGFTQDMGFRVFVFEGMGEDRVRTRFTVRADLSLIRNYGIRLQDLPLLCRSLLDRRDTVVDARTLTFTENEMSVHAKDCAERESSRKREGRRIGRPGRAPEQSLSAQ